MQANDSQPMSPEKVYRLMQTMGEAREAIDEVIAQARREIRILDARIHDPLASLD